MRLNAQQKITVTAIALLFLVAIGASVFIRSDPEVGGTRTILLSTSTPTQEASSTGWWDAIPTDPALPAMPNGSSSTMTPSTP
jgi:hypothetical protein